MNYPDMDSIYKTKRPEDIPWNITEPPEVLVNLVEDGTIQPGKTIDFGCGTGHYATYLATKGFDVTGVDSSPSAIEMAKENAGKKGVTCNFVTADVTGDLHEIQDTYDFAYDWELLHHIFPEDREKYVKNVHKLLNANGKYLSVCFSEMDPQFGGTGKFRKTPLGTVLYFSSEFEIRNLFSPYFDSIEITTVAIPGKTAPHYAVVAFMVKK